MTIFQKDKLLSKFSNPYYQSDEDSGVYTLTNFFNRIIKKKNKTNKINSFQDNVIPINISEPTSLKDSLQLNRQDSVKSRDSLGLSDYLKLNRRNSDISEYKEADTPDFFNNFEPDSNYFDSKSFNKEPSLTSSFNKASSTAASANSRNLYNSLLPKSSDIIPSDLNEYLNPMEPITKLNSNLNMEYQQRHNTLVDKINSLLEKQKINEQKKQEILPNFKRLEELSFDKSKNNTTNEYYPEYAIVYNKLDEYAKEGLEIDKILNKYKEESRLNEKKMKEGYNPNFEFQQERKNKLKNKILSLQEKLKQNSLISHNNKKNEQIVLEKLSNYMKDSTNPYEYKNSPINEEYEKLKNEKKEIQNERLKFNDKQTSYNRKLNNNLTLTEYLKQLNNNITYFKTSRQSKARDRKINKYEKKLQELTNKFL